MPDTRIYAVTDADETALIRAASKAQAIRHFVAARVTAEVATQGSARGARQQGRQGAGCGGGDGGVMESAALIESAGISNENDEWYTPAWFFKALGVTFDLDPCSPGCPPSSVPAARWLTKADNGLTAEWAGSVWLNPPFSSKRDWYERLVKHGNGISLMPNRTETHDLQSYMSAAQALLFLRGRIYFERGSRPGANRNGQTTTPPFGIVLCAYGARMAEALLQSELLGVRAAVYERSTSRST